MNDTTQFLMRHGTPLLFAGVLIDQMSLPVPGLPWLLAAGALAATGKFNLFTGIAATLVASLSADAFWLWR